MIRHIAIFSLFFIDVRHHFCRFGNVGYRLARALGALNGRMLLMKDVAAYKMKHHLPIEDFTREQNVLPG